MSSARPGLPQDGQSVRVPRATATERRTVSKSSSRRGRSAGTLQLRRIPAVWMLIDQNGSPSLYTSTLSSSAG